MHYEISLVPKDLIVEANSEEDLKERLKHISVDGLVFSYKAINKDDLRRILKERHIYPKSQ